jgi:hypothetical protein
MSVLSRVFGSKDVPEKPQPGQLTQRLEKLEAEAESAAPGYVGTSYNRARDVALRDALVLADQTRRIEGAILEDLAVAIAVGTYDTVLMGVR